MPRPKKCRKICGIPESCRFGPVSQEEGPGAGAGELSGKDAVEMTLDEYETIRLIDLLDYTQEECAVQMGVARTTVQSVYNEARKKLALVLTEGKYLSIKGGNYVVCSRSGSCPGRKKCCHR